MLDTVAGDNPQAIILFSKSASGCSLTPNSGFSFQMLYSMTNSNEGSAIQTGLLNRQQISAQIGPDNSNSNSSSGNNNNSGGNGGNGAGTPTTAVAMIILYSVTGVITALFLLIIVTGAVRAHRHPERYGPRNVLGRTRQSRARGLARAMLDTIPIVKFGEAHEQPKPADQDVELANTAGQPGNETTATGGGTKHGGIESAAEVVATPSDGASTTMPGASASHDPASHDQVQPVSSADHLEEHQPATNSNEEGLTCSICTDEFVKGQDIRVLPCNHKFHPECVDPWLLNVSGTCPLCRIDLRPTTSRTSENDRQESDSHDHGRNGLPPPLAADAETATGGPGNRSSRRFSAFIHQTLGPSRMQDATAEERIAVLRRFRDHWRQNNETSASDRNGSGVAPNYPDGEQDRSTRQRLNARFRDTFHIRTRRRDSMLVGATHDQHGPTASSASNNDQPPPEVNGDPASRV
ncbi:hypothetical protein L228DRAFT_135944 [Xylona heveae TC161]|uniref:RING-type domain-containing protein n=1 Tax=Xylona heveae (strain CBS 132557 / TC161) TaxID=1328760 RepID=A0A165GZ55_XYLHT|nr:hypothetical protein L228DRAFT_135944 [Xylona heveae TC161]KZF22784.1 hypothetical protein L228DRAFT_135944 [Xylona heveae TC161]